MKKTFMIGAGIVLGLCGYSQSIQQQIEKEINDPQRKANSGKADWIIADKKNISDSTGFNKDNATGSNTKDGSERNKQCGPRTRHSNKAGASKKI